MAMFRNVTDLLGGRILRHSALLLPLLVLTACQTTGTVDVFKRPASSGTITLQLQPCTDRTGTKERDLAGEATSEFRKALAASGNFVLSDDGQYRLACDVTDFQAGSAFQRWLLPGWGQTAGKVSVMLSDAKTGETQAIIVGEARVSAGGFYTIGADAYIMATAVDDVVKKLQAWARGENTTSLRPFRPAKGTQAKRQTT